MRNLNLSSFNENGIVPLQFKPINNIILQTYVLVFARFIEPYQQQFLLSIVIGALKKTLTKM